jgi:hypothetical protein
MAALRNPRHEKFAMEIALGASPRQAYVASGYRDSKNARPNGSRLRHSPAVSARIGELLKEWGEDCKVQLSWIQHQLLEIAEGRAVSRTVVNGKGELIEERDRLAALNALLKSVGAGDVDVSVTFNDLGRRLDDAIRRTKQPQTIDVTPPRSVLPRTASAATSSQSPIVDNIHDREKPTAASRSNKIMEI